MSNGTAKGRIGSSFDDYLAEEGILEECEAAAIKELLALQVEEAIKARGISKTEMARRMRTSRTQLNRLLDPTNTSVTLQTMQRAAAIAGKKLRIELA